MNAADIANAISVMREASSFCRVGLLNIEQQMNLAKRIDEASFVLGLELTKVIVPVMSSDHCPPQEHAHQPI